MAQLNRDIFAVKLLYKILFNVSVNPLNVFKKDESFFYL